MRRLLILLPAFFGVVLSGCGDPAPTTKLAPDQPAGDASKLTAEQLASAHKANNPSDRK